MWDNTECSNSEDNSYHCKHKDIMLMSIWKLRKKGIQVLVFFTIACLITFWRLTFGCVNIVYLIHSIIIFIDLVLGSVLSSNLIFNLTLNIIAISHSLWYKCSGRVMTEFTETTLMAVAASMYSLYLKYKHRKQIEHVSQHEHQWYEMHMYLQEKLGATPVEFLVEEFLDGAAGIMYTSFLGLVISELAVLLLPTSHDEYLYCIWSKHLVGC